MKNRPSSHGLPSPHNRAKAANHDLAALRRRQIAQLRRYLRDAVLPFSKHYAKLFAEHSLTANSIQTWSDLQKIPFTSKADLVVSEKGDSALKDFVLIPDPKILQRRPSTIFKAIFRGKRAVQAAFEREFRPIFMTSTTGRSTEPVPFLYTQHDLDHLSLASQRILKICDAKKDFRLLNLFPFAPHLAFWTTHYAAVDSGVFCVSSGGGKVMGTEGNLRLIEKIKPDALIGMPTFLYHVLSEAVAEKVHCPTLKKLVLGGEKVPDGMRQKLRSLAAQIGAPQIDVIATYAFTEAKMAWTECPSPDGAQPSGYHISRDLALVELVDPKTGEMVVSGGGEVVFTPLDARGTVVLRYRTGDIAEGGLVHDRCPFCGRVGLRLVGPISRNSEIRELNLNKLKGTLVDLNQLEIMLDNQPGVGAWQLELRKKNDDPLEIDELILHVQKIGSQNDDTLREVLNTRFAETIEVHPNRIEFHDEKAMRKLQGVGVQLKEERIVDHRPATNHQPSQTLDESSRLAKTP